jgi:predicted DNA repair protein MutK
MNILGIHVLTEKQFELLKNAGHEITYLAATPVQQAVAALTALPIGSAIHADIVAIESKTMTGPQKFEAVVAKTLPALVETLAAHGVGATIAEVADIGRELVQSIFNAFTSKIAPSLAGAIVDGIGHLSAAAVEADTASAGSAATTSAPDADAMTTAPAEPEADKSATE